MSTDHPIPGSSTEPHPPLIRIGERPGLGRYLAWTWQRMDFAIELSLSELRSENMNTVLGNVWHLLNPLFLGVIYFLVFGIIFDARGDVPNYPAFLMVGILTFYFTQKNMNAGARVVAKNRGMIQTINFPRTLLPLSATLTHAIAHTAAILVMMLLVVASGVAIQLSWLLLVPIALLQALFNFGLACAVARLTFHFRDIENLLPYLTRLWLYMSGVMYTIQRVPEGAARTIFRLNPAFVFIDLSRDALLRGETRADNWLLAGSWAVAVAILGFLYFWRHESEYARA